MSTADAPGDGGRPGTTRRPFTQPRVAELVADVLRDRIVSGEFADGKMLPKQKDLLDEFRISLPSLREAMRILETEGLVSVQRGNVGGAVVHRPTSGSAAFILGMVLQSQGVVLSDLAAALRVVEPACAAMCAGSPSRRRIASSLREIVRESERTVEDGPAFTRSSRHFHDELARQCANTTLRELVGTLETIWSSYEAGWADETTRRGVYPELKLRRRDISDHDAIADAIHDGDEQAAADASRRHLEQVHRYLLKRAGNEPVAVTRLQRRRPVGL